MATEYFIRVDINAEHLLPRQHRGQGHRAFGVRQTDIGPTTAYVLWPFQGIAEVFPVRPSGAGRVIQGIEFSAMDVRIGAGKIALLYALGIKQKTSFHTVHVQQLIARDVER